ncbi:MAG: response regulator [Candidatus Omnitrophota bacterium]
MMQETDNAIMVVDDDEIFLEELSESLALSGYNMIAVSDPTEVIDLASGLKPKLILLDINMPGKTGLEIIREIGKLPEFDDVPVIVMSGFFQDELMLLNEIRGIKRLVKKPFGLADILGIIRDTLKGIPA